MVIIWFKWSSNDNSKDNMSSSFDSNIVNRNSSKNGNNNNDSNIGEKNGGSNK